MTSVYGQLNAVGPWVKGDSFVTVMENATITNNSWDGPAVRGIGAGAGGRDMVLVNVDVSDNDIDAQAFACLDAEIEVSYTNVRSSGTLPDSECMVGTPSNEDPTYSADYDLLTGSPLIDAGDPSILDADGTTSDIGWTGGPGG